MTKKEPTYGVVTATQEEGGYFHIDYDDVSLRIIEDEVRMLHSEFKLGDCVLVETSPNRYHTIFFWDTLTWREIMSVFKSTKHADIEFIEYTSNRGVNRIRIHGNFKEIIRIKSRHHKQTQLGDFRYLHYQRSTGIL